MSIPKNIEQARSESIHVQNKKEKQSKVAHSLCNILADTYTLLLKTQNFHWNVRGHRFLSIHQLTEEQYQDMFAAVDDIAERIRALGYFTPASFAKFSEGMSLQESDQDSPPDESTMLQRLESDHIQLVQELKEAIKVCEDEEDSTTQDMLSERRGFHEKAAWMLRSLNAK